MYVFLDAIDAQVAFLFKLRESGKIECVLHKLIWCKIKRFCGEVRKKM